MGGIDPSLPTSVVQSSQTAAVDPAPNSGLSTGATAGIAVGAVIVGLGIVVLILMLWRSKRKQDSAHPRNSAQVVPFMSTSGTGSTTRMPHLSPARLCVLF